jgi:hypothetical protein
MDAPVCPICGKKHWSRVCNDRALQTVTFEPGVTMPITPEWPVPRSVAPSKLAAALAEVERLEAETMHLKKLLADQHQKTVPVEDRNRIAPTGSTALALENEALRGEVAYLKMLLAGKPPMTSKERVAKHRAKKRA